MGDKLRNGDVEALRSKLRDEGRPMKSSIVIKDGRQYHHSVDRKGRVDIKDVV